MNELNGVVKKFALYDNGKRLTEFEFDEGKEKNGVYILWNKKQVVLYDKETTTKKLVIKDNICHLFFKENYFIVRIDDGTDFNPRILTNSAYSYDGKVLIEPYKYDSMQSYEQVIITYSIANYDKMYLHNLEGKPLVTPICSFQNVYPRRKGVIVEKNGKYGFYSYKGELLVPIEYDDYYEVLKLTKDIEVDIIDTTLPEQYIF